METTKLGTYGIDIYFDGSDVLPSLQLINTEIIVLQALVRRLTTTRGRLFYDQEYGFNINDILKAPLQSTSFYKSEIKNEVLKDERVSSADVSLSLVDEVLTINIKVLLEDGEEFLLIFSINNKTNEELEVLYQRL